MTGPEMTALALLLIVQQLDDASDWASWDVVPGLDEEDHAWLLDELADTANNLRRRLYDHEHRFGVRSSEVLARATKEQQ